MSPLIVLAIGGVIGTVLGLLGGGGALLATPVLMYVFQFPLKAAIGSSLCMVTLGAIPAVMAYAFKRQIHYGASLILGLTGAAGAIVGSQLAAYAPNALLYWLLIAMMALSCWLTLKPKPKPKEKDTTTAPPASDTHQGEPIATPLPKLPLALSGLGIGLLTGSVGVGGGFLLVPALLLIAKLPPRQAIASSLAIILTNAASGVVGYWQVLPSHDARFHLVLVGMMLGSVAGFLLSFRLPQPVLKVAFGWLLASLTIAMALWPPAH